MTDAGATEQQVTIDELLGMYSESKRRFSSFGSGIVTYLNDHPSSTVIHSLKQRIKDEDHLREKSKEKWTGAGK